MTNHSCHYIIQKVKHFVERLKFRLVFGGSDCTVGVWDSERVKVGIIVSQMHKLLATD